MAKLNLKEGDEDIIKVIFSAGIKVMSNSIGVEGTDDDLLLDMQQRAIQIRKELIAECPNKKTDKEQ